MEKNPFVSDEQYTPEIPTGTLQIYQGINDYFEERNDTNVNRASAANMCVKRRWHQRKGFKGSALTPRKLVNFLLGDLSERTVLYFIKSFLVGPGKLYQSVDFGETLGTIRFQNKDIELYQQKTMSFTHNGMTITGHADGFGVRNLDGEKELIEIKSAADYGFSEFQENGPGDYLLQSHALMKMSGVKSTRFFYLRKSTGHIWDRLHHWDEKIESKMLEGYITAEKDEEPQAPYDYVEEKFRGKPTGKLTLPWNCGYCNMREHCKPESKVEFKKDQFGNMKPVYYKEMK